MADVVAKHWHTYGNKPRTGLKSDVTQDRQIFQQPTDSHSNKKLVSEAVAMVF